MSLVTKYSGLARPLDMNYRSNRLVLICSGAALLVAGSLFFLYEENTVLNSIIAGLRAAVIVFITWALTRELAPEAPSAALLSIILITLGLFWQRWPQVLELLLILNCLRIVNGTSGRPPTWPDWLGSLALAAYLAWQGVWAVAAFMPVAVWLYQKHTRQLAAKPYYLLLGFSGLLITALGFARLEQLEPGYLSTPATMAVVVIASGFAFYLRRTTRTAAVDDTHHQPLAYRRLRSAQFMALLGVALLSLWLGSRGFTQFMPVWAGFAAVCLTLPLHDTTSRTV